MGITISGPSLLSRAREHTELGNLTDFPAPPPHDEATLVRLPYAEDLALLPADNSNSTDSHKAAKTSENEQPLAILREPVYKQPNNNNSSSNSRKAANGGSIRARARRLQSLSGATRNVFSTCRERHPENIRIFLWSSLTKQSLIGSNKSAGRNSS